MYKINFSVFQFRPKSMFFLSIFLLSISSYSYLILSSLSSLLSLVMFGCFFFALCVVGVGVSCASVARGGEAVRV